MKYIGKKSLSFVMEIALIGIMAVNLLVLVFLPWISMYYLQMIYGAVEVCQRTTNILLIVLYPCGIFSFIVAFNLKRIFRTLVNRDPFVQRNVKSLKAMGLAMAGVTAFLILKVFLMNSIMTMMGVLASSLLAVFCFVLADVFQQAVYYKQDNELTI